MNVGTQVICKFKFLCDKKWDDLQIIENEADVRFCNGCLKPVFYTQSYDELTEHVSEERCVAVSINLEGLLPPSEIVDFGGSLLGKVITEWN